jgi:dTMP kinase
VLREPGGVDLAERIRSLVADPGVAVDARAEALLFAAARAQLVEEVVAPARARGAWVVCDRFLDSSVAYQGGARELGLDTVRELSVFATGGLLPDRTVLLVGERRDTGEPDRIEREDGAFHQRVADGFDVIARREPDRLRTVDATGSVDDVGDRVWEAVHA